METELLNIINTVLDNNDLAHASTIDDSTRLRDDLGFDSLGLAELTVRIERDFGVDVFSDGVVETVGEVLIKINGDA